MKPRALLLLFISLLLIAAFVIGATLIESSYQWNALAWLWAQRKLPMLWLVDTFAVLALFPVFGLAAAQKNLTGKSKEMAQMQGMHHEQLEQMKTGHHTQMEQMLHNAEKSEQANAQQAEQITALQQSIEELAVKLAAMGTEAAKRYQALEEEATIRHQGLEEEALRIAAQAFSALMDRVEANTRQMEAVNLAVQYQRAEVKQLRQSVRVLQHNQETREVARLTPAEIAAIANEEILSIEGRHPQARDTQAEDTRERDMQKRQAERQDEPEKEMRLPNKALVYETPDTPAPFSLRRDMS